MIIGYTSGVFDLLHEGHLNYLQICKENCDVFVVAIDTDNMVKIKKGLDRPIQKDKTRLSHVEVTDIADFVILKEKETICMLKEINPSIYFVPDDKIVSKEIQSFAIFSRMKLGVIPYTIGISTTILIEKFISGEY